MSNAQRNRGLRLAVSAFLVAAVVAGCENRDRTDYDTNASPGTTRDTTMGGTGTTTPAPGTSGTSGDTMTGRTDTTMSGAPRR